MYTIQPKKMVIINILEILKRYSDENHKLSQKDIIELLERDYMMTINRRTVKRNLLNLLDSGYNLEYTESVRINQHGEEEITYTDWYLERNFTDAELHLIIDSLLFSRHINDKNCGKLIQKISGLSNIYFKSRAECIHPLSPRGINVQELFYNIEVLNEAISKGKQVLFHYEEYGKDLKLHHRRNHKNEPKEYLMNPYQMVTANSRYYLICNMDKYDDIAHYRVDWIRDIKLLETKAKPMNRLKGLENGLNLPRHMAEHIYMFTGDTIPITFRVDKIVWNQVVDWFQDITVLDETEHTYTARVKVNERAMHHWAIQYGEYVEVIKPERLRQDVIETVDKIKERYRC